MTAPKTGDKIRVEYEGIVTGKDWGTGGQRLVRLRREDGKPIAVNVKYVTVIEPAYATGKMYEAADGVFFLRCDSGWIFAASGGVVSDDIPLRPLRKLVPEADFSEVAARL
jgi:hypothetical protein